MHLVAPVSWLLALALALPTGALLVRVFIVQHDCGHGSFFASRRANALVGRAVQPDHDDALRQLEPPARPAPCRLEQPRPHGGGSDIYSACLTVEEYLALSPWRRFLYRLPRHPLIANLLLPPLVFLLLYRVPFDTPRAWVRERWSVHLTNAALVCLFGTLVLLLGWREVLLVHLPIMVGGVDPGRLAVLAAAPLRDGALDGARRLELRRRGAAAARRGSTCRGRCTG